jgi:signal transduction histidine kinase
VCSWRQNRLVEAILIKPMQTRTGAQVLNLIVTSELQEDRVIPLRALQVTVGRSGACDVTLSDRKVSARHFEVVRAGQHFILRDLDSTNGTFVNGRRVSEAMLRIGDEITAGLTQILFTNQGRFEKTARLVIGESEDDSGFVVHVPLEDVEKRFLGSLQCTGSPDLTQRLNMIYRLGSTLNNILEVDELFDRVMDLVIEAVPCDRAYAFLYQEGRLFPKVVRRREGIEAGEGLAVSGTMLAQVLRAGEAVFTRDASADERFRGGDSIHRFSIRSALAVPMMVKDSVLGVIYLDRVTALRSFQQDDLQILAMICNHAASNLANARLFQELRVTNEQLRKAKSEILHWNIELEAKVEERTCELASQAERIAKLSEQKDELLGMVAHDLRSPLTSICGYLEVIDQQLACGERPERARADLGVTREIVHEMADLLNDLLDVARIESGRVRIEPTPESVEGLFGTCLRHFEVLVASRGLTLRLDVEPGLPQVRCDRRRIAQVLSNLVHNAVKFSGEGGEIVLSARREGGELRLSVADTGPGIPEGELEAIFGQFVQSTATEAVSHGGAGLGLAIARKLVLLHGGRIWAESNVGDGARFTFTLPL